MTRDQHFHALLRAAGESYDRDRLQDPAFLHALNVAAGSLARVQQVKLAWMGERDDRFTVDAHRE